MQTVRQHASLEEGWDPSSKPSTMIISVLSSDVRLALRAMRNYTTALEVEWIEPECRVAIAHLLNCKIDLCQPKYKVIDLLDHIGSPMTRP